MTTIGDMLLQQKEQREAELLAEEVAAAAQTAAIDAANKLRVSRYLDDMRSTITQAAEDGSAYDYYSNSMTFPLDVSMYNLVKGNNNSSYLYDQAIWDNFIGWGHAENIDIQFCHLSTGAIIFKVTTWNVG